MKSFDITISGYGLTKTFRKIEIEKHEEFYVNAINKFNEYLKKKNIIQKKNYMDHLISLQCSFVENFY